jgi:hypothetical protein
VVVCFCIVATCLCFVHHVRPSAGVGIGEDQYPCTLCCFGIVTMPDPNLPYGPTGRGGGCGDVAYLCVVEKIGHFYCASVTPKKEVVLS